MFLDLTEEAACKLEDSEHGELVTLAETSHYGTGDYEVDIDFILSNSNPEQLMNELLEVATQSLTKSKTSKKGQMMGSFKFDGQYLKEGSRVVANVKGPHPKGEEDQRLSQISKTTIFVMGVDQL